MELFIIDNLEIENKKLIKLYDYLDKDRVNRAEKLINEQDKTQLLICEILIRVIIIKYLNIKNDQIRFEKNNFGKLYLKENSNFYFNCSYSDEVITCLIDRKEVGIDIEKIIDFNFEDIITTFFSTSEINYINKSNNKERIKKFYEIWTLKESYIKFIGKGLSFPLNKFSINIDYNGISANSNNCNKPCNFQVLDYKNRYIISLCTISKINVNQLKILNPNFLIQEFVNLL